jgi:ADP-ribose pyrophosphatase
MTRWQRGPRTRVHENPFFNVYRSEAASESARKTYFVVDFGVRAGMVALDGSRVLLVRQYRFLADGYCWEIPGGSVRPSERPEDAAIRETVEETGILCQDVEPLIAYYPSYDNVDNLTSVFISRRHSVASPFAPDAHEVVELRWVELAEAMEMCGVRGAYDGFTMLALMAARKRLG